MRQWRSGIERHVEALQIDRQVRGVLVSLCAARGQRLVDDPVKLQGDIGHAIVGGDRPGLADAPEDLQTCASLERELSRGHLIENRPKRKDV
jgi:hypothetical protein